ncbi:leucine-rich repeat-containing protein 1 [Onthophagus taurus]|uniref:leucine-rich repeat-containing protein 1 n=1 Tax=Onthophagus taurus TaxID=166361 RepID=UPI000C2064E8|nr:leucine-rich repeat-containing protein 1 [Onthophagus taurus]
MNWFNCFACKQKTVDNVKSLDFSRTSLNEVPGDIFQYERTLENLYLDGNKIIDLPRTLFQCEELRHLDISDNEIQNIPNLISKLVNLHTLNVSRNCLKYTDVPSAIHRCQKLAIFDISTNTLEKVPEGLTSLINLRELYLNDTYIEFLPANFGRLCNLKILELRDNNLTTLPKSLRRLSSLVRLDLSNNDFAEMPEVIVSMLNLKELWINGNCISSLCPGIGNLQNLLDFDASKNDIEKIPQEIGRCVKLTNLILSNNLLSEIPEVISNLKLIQTLKLDYNCLDSLPYGLGELVNLEELDVQNNRLTSLPSSIGYLRKLNYFVASHNFLVYLPPEIGSCVSLTVLNLHNNMLKKLPEEIGHLQNLTSLGLIGNKLEYLPIPVANLPHLRALWLTQNQSHPLIPLQTEKLEGTNQLVLTCFLLPQIQQIREEKFLPPQNISVPKRHIAFSEPGIPKELPVRLTRAPTPYPKDFQRFQRSLNNQLKRNRETTGSIPQIKEAKVTPMKETGDVYDEEIDDNHHLKPVLDNQRHGFNTDITSLDGSDQSKGSLELQENLSCVATQPKQPPPYHIAAAYSKNAKLFNNLEGLSGDKPKNFTQELPQNVNVTQPTPYNKIKAHVDEGFLKELNTRLMNAEVQKNNINCESHQCNMKLLRVNLTPCCYVLGFSITYNEKGVFINKVDENGNAFKKLFPGDKILMLDKQDLTKMEPWQAYKTVLIQGPETESFFISRYEGH